MYDAAEARHACLDPVVPDAAADPDNDGLSNHIEVVALSTNPCLWDADQDNDLLPDALDNCPAVANPEQRNEDTRLSNGPGIPGDDSTNPGGDGLGDACDDDDDSDGLPDVEDTEPLGGTGICAAFAGSSSGHASPSGGDLGYSDGNPPSWDTDGDAVPDGRECIVGTNPRIGVDAHRAMCAATIATADADADGLQDVWELCGWGTSAVNTNSDGDSRNDCTEVIDVNGNGALTNGDAAFVQQHFFAIIVGDRASMDTNRNGAVTNGDATLIRQAFFGINACV
jgi:hypothetical protein